MKEMMRMRAEMNEAENRQQKEPKKTKGSSLKILIKLIKCW